MGSSIFPSAAKKTGHFTDFYDGGKPGGASQKPAKTTLAVPVI
jgi:hypothetical protein